MRLNSKVVYLKCFQRYWKRLLVENRKSYCQLCIDFKSSKIKLKIKKKSKCSLYQLQLEAHDILLYPKVNFCTPSNLGWLKNTCQLYFTFLISSIIITQFLSECLKSELHLLPASEIEKFHILVLNFGHWTVGITVSISFRIKSGHSNESVYLTLIDRMLKTLLTMGLGNFLRPTTCESWNCFRTSSAVFLIKIKQKYRILITFSSKNYKQKLCTTSKMY